MSTAGHGSSGRRPATADDSRLAGFYCGRRVCVTGGAGFIGSHLTDALVGLGARVGVVDDLSSGLRSNLDQVAPFVEFFEGTILDAPLLRRAFAGASVIFHLAAVASVPRSVREPALYCETNAIGTVQVLEAARAIDPAPTVVYAASSSAYGDQPGLPRVESMAPDVRSPYAAVKCAGEYFVRAYAHSYRRRAVSLRYFNIFGPRQRPDSPYAAVIPLFAEAMLEGRRPRIFGDGSQTRDFTFVANAVRANLLAGACERELNGQVINIGCGQRATLLDLARGMAEILGADPEFEFAPSRPGEVMHSLADISAARDLIGYEPLVTLAEGLRTTVKWYAGGGAAE